MIPDPWPALVLVFGAYRLLRLGGWDDFPPIYKVRAWIIGERWIPETPLVELGRCLTGNGEPCMGQCDIPSCPANLNLPGKQPSSEVPTLRPAYSRPLLAHLVHCPFCLGWWISLAVYVAWLIEPRWTLYALAPFALSGTIGLIAKNLDA